MNLKLDVEPVKGPDCKGLVFRGHVSTYRSGNHIEQRSRLTLLKRESCPGCRLCGWVMEDIDEHLAMDPECSSVVMPDIEEGALYTPTRTNITRGYHDDGDEWTWEFVKIPEEK